MKKHFWITLLSFIVIFVFASFTRVSAREILAHEQMEHPSTHDIVAEITLYDDYIVEYDYKTTQLTNVKIKVCKSNVCEDTAYQIEPQQTFMNGQEANFDVSEYLVKEENKIKYKIIASGDFKTSDSGSWVGIILEHEVTISGSNETTDNMDEEDFDESLVKVKKVFNTWIIPGIYIILGIVIVVKGILLAIDIVKYSDNPEIRKRKLHATIYLLLALLFVAIINTGIGFMTGLFESK